MVTKREIAAAQNEMIDNVARLCDELQRLRAGHLSDTWPIGVGVSSSILRPVLESYDHWDILRQTLEGEGAAVARATSIAAAKSRLMGKQSLRRDILVMVVAHHNKWQVGMTSEQIQARIPKGTHQTVSARVSELVNTYQLLRDSGRKIETTSGSKATVWEPTDEARELVAAQITGREP